MAYTPMFGSMKRERLWLAQCANAHRDRVTDGSCPVCNICDQPVTREQADRDGWHESHLPWRGAPVRLRSVGVAHVACNLEHGRTVVVPAAAKSKRILARNNGAKGPGLGRHPMRAGRRSRFTLTMRHGLRPRRTLAEKHAAFLAKRAIVPLEAPSLVPTVQE